MFHLKTDVPVSGNSAPVAGMAAPPEAMTYVGEDRRAQHRRRVLKPARLVFHNRLSVMDVVVRDLANGGMRIRAGEYQKLPETCEVQLKDDKIARTVRLVWRNGNEGGVALIG
jgi:hypothetical protein